MSDTVGLTNKKKEKKTTGCRFEAGFVFALVLFVYGVQAPTGPVVGRGGGGGLTGNGLGLKGLHGRVREYEGNGGGEVAHLNHAKTEMK